MSRSPSRSRSRGLSPNLNQGRGEKCRKIDLVEPRGAANFPAKICEFFSGPVLTDILGAMRNDSSDERARRSLESYQIVSDARVFAIGAFDTSVTVLSQQIRALNLVWALDKASIISADRPTRIAVVGGGFAGLTFSAGILGKSIPAQITLLERRDSILALQHGSDTRWLHPHIYDWPMPGSEATSAGLPVLNWTAARASDVAVQVVSSWRTLVSATENRGASVRLFCNATRVRVDRGGDGKLQIEWMGQERAAGEPSRATGADAQRGTSETFDIVVLATGFGTEIDGGLSYWRNETLGQPALDRSRMDYLISGYGDGGWIDLFRLRIMSFRQDRILGELFAGMTDFVEALRQLRHDLSDQSNAVPSLDKLWKEKSSDAEKAGDRLRWRLRHDTRVVLQLRKNQSFSDLFDGQRASFQNQLLGWMLFRLGAFDIRVGELDRVAQLEGIPDKQVIRRHGPRPFDHLVEVLGGSLRAAVADDTGAPVDQDLKLNKRQSNSIFWSGGYFDRPLNPTDDKDKAHWNREYLPASTQLLSSALCGLIARQLAPRHPADIRLRLTLHRRVSIGDEVVLQQCCEYFGLHLDHSVKTAGRTFPHRNGLIGQAFSLKKIVRSTGDSSVTEVREAMEHLRLEAASRPMADGVRSYLAIPCIDNVTSKVVSILFLDSFEPAFFDDDDLVKSIVVSIQGFFDGVIGGLPLVADSFANVSYWTDPDVDVDDSIASSKTLEVVAIDCPSVAVDRINVDLASFVEVGSDG